jgi:cytochrome c peroxidase
MISRCWPASLAAGVCLLVSSVAVAQDKATFEWQLPKSGSVRQTPILFVSPNQVAEWKKLKTYWTPDTATGEDPETGLAVKKNVVKVKLPLGLGVAPVPPPENAMTVERWELGRKLYFDPILSSDQTVACVSCHSPKFGFADSGAVSIGIGGRKGGVSAPTVANAAFNVLQFWDGRAQSLEAQAQGPVGNDAEMFDGQGHPWHTAIGRIRKNPDYVKAFLLAYGTEPTQDAAAKAIATYERTVLTGNSIHDRAEQAMKQRVTDEESGKFEFVAKDYEKVLAEAFEQGDKNALAALQLSDKAKIGEVARRINEGRALFFGKARCSLCHVGQNFSDSEFHNLGVGARDGKLPPESYGRFERLPLGHKNPDFLGAFKTPTLRGLVKTAPYMHDGSEKTLEEVIELYNRGGNVNPFLSPKMRDLEAEKAYRRAKAGGEPYKGREAKVLDGKVIVPFTLNLSAEEKGALVLFLRSLQGEVDALVSDPRIPAVYK